LDNYCEWEKFGGFGALLLVKKWNPPQSPLCIEYPEELLCGLEADPARIETTGLLYGVREGNTVRVQSLQAGQDRLGIYVVRLRGEVFLTERNIELFERTGANVVLVMAGAKAGFFVRDAQGALESIRSYEEFDIPPVEVRRRKAVLAAGLLCLSAIPLIALAYLKRMS
jgi:hypothetical protein